MISEELMVALSFQEMVHLLTRRAGCVPNSLFGTKCKMGRLVECRLLVFRPFVGEIIDAKLKEFDKDGLRLSMGFFDDIYIPFHLLPHPSRFEPDLENGNRFRWIWEYREANGENEADQASGTVYPIDEIGETIRFRVQSVNYPSIPLEQPKDSKPFAPMVITGSLDNDGLGPISWWE
ncbi:DNA-directed RNA polymerase III subunit rpc8 isoform X3 [Rhodamnia argentea]|uniref:DNA-directed RNA polymerase subunit n=1 Tax=Rhodamnia argentea TaxID=178133 RepID=A0ABM3HHL5_9MYRT|nr:DNA-directed RNA polymerase III subunit rpc8 isoform X3 [Rhodamnia argentea]XP_048136096.1 DNA-directed RNA polymerase III subunit rpc8 isoform X3 [Rhodamnia argentea]